MPLTKSLVQIVLEELRDSICHAPHPTVLGNICARRKSPMQSFCRSCYFKLPEKARRELYKSMADGYAEIYDEAKELLKGL